MVKRCIVANCSNTNKDGVSLHFFPKDLHVRKQWTQQVQRTRADFKEPSKHSVVCSSHFTADCFEGLGENVGMKIKRMLKPEAVPTIFPPRPSDIRIVSRRSEAFAKRERARVSSTVLYRSNYC